MWCVCVWCSVWGGGKFDADANKQYVRYLIHQYLQREGILWSRAFNLPNRPAIRSVPHRDYDNT